MPLYFVVMMELAFWRYMPIITSVNFPVGYTLDDQNFVAAHLEPDEELVWTAKPQPRLFWAGPWGCLLIVVSSVCFASLIFALLVYDIEIPLFLWVVVGLFCSIAIVSKLRIFESKIIYVITNRRAMILYSPYTSLDREWSGSNLQVLDVKLHGKDVTRGHVVFERDDEGGIMGFLNVPQPLVVAEKIKLCAEEGCRLERKGIEREISHHAHITVPAPSGQDGRDVARWLSHGERLLWVGRPHVRLWTSGMLSVGVVGLMVWFVVYVESDLVLRMFQEPVVMASAVSFGVSLVLLIGLPLFLVSLWLWNCSSKTRYILTDKRALVVRPYCLTGMMKLVHTWDLDRDSIKKISERSRRGGYDIVWSYHPKISINGKPLAEGFLDMESVEMPLAALARIQGFDEANTSCP